MRLVSGVTVLAIAGAASARPDAVASSRALAYQSGRAKREVPQEHSHEAILRGVATALNVDNVDNVQDPVFALLGNAAAAEGAGDVQDLDCLQQRVADQAFTNAKAAADVPGMTNALLFRALERNTGKVGQASVLCESETATNPEVAALQQHQDPASAGAAETNKAVTLELARQLASVGADPQLALQSGTFAPGDPNDPTGAGNSCDDANDAEGCIISQGLLVPDATAAEVDEAAAAGGAVGGGGGGGGNVSTPATPVTNSTVAARGAVLFATRASSNNGTSTSDGVDINAFTGSVGAPPVPITSSSASARPFAVNGSTFTGAGAAVQRACDVQKNACANAANSSGAGGGGVAECDAQQQQCLQANAGAVQRRRRRDGFLRARARGAAFAGVRG